MRKNSGRRMTQSGFTPLRKKTNRQTGRETRNEKAMKMEGRGGTAACRQISRACRKLSQQAFKGERHVSH